MKNFTRFIGIDWSGARAPYHTKAIAVSEALQGREAPVLVEGPWSRMKVFSYLAALAMGKTRVLAGIDCNFGYAQDIGLRQFGASYTAPTLWDAVEAANADVPNFFAGGYWTHEKHGALFWQSGKMPEGFSMPRRTTEQVCGDCGHGWPESPFKLIGAKQVGKGGLAGMRLVRALKHEFGEKVAIYPFDSGYDDARLVVTEIYPRLFLRKAGHGNTKIRDMQALNTALSALGSNPMPETSAFSDHQADAIVSAAGLRALCGNAKTVPEALARPPADSLTLSREGWIFGAGV